MVLDDKGAVKPERLGLDIVLDPLAEALAAIRQLGFRIGPPRLRAAEKSKPHRCLRVCPLRPSGGRGRGPSRSDGRVRWVSASALESPTSPQPSPPPRAERERTADIGLYRAHPATPWGVCTTVASVPWPCGTSNLMPPVLAIHELQISPRRCSKPSGITTWMWCGAPVTGFLIGSFSLSS